MILITGASGQLGRLVIDHLATKVDPSTIIAGARSTDKVADLAGRGITVRHLDYTDPASIATAVEGVEQVLLISGTDLGQRVEQHRAVIDAATAAGVKHLAYTSLANASTSTIPVAEEHKATEELLAAAPMTTTALRHGWYMENYTENLEPVLQNGAVIGAAGDGRVSAATRNDYAAADAAVLADSNLWGETYELGGAPFTMSEYASAVSAATGKEIPYVNMPAAELLAAYSGAGLPEFMAEFLVQSDLGIGRGELQVDPAVLERLAGPITPLSAAVEAAID